MIAAAAAKSTAAILSFGLAGAVLAAQPAPDCPKEQQNSAGECSDTAQQPRIIDQGGAYSKLKPYIKQEPGYSKPAQTDPAGAASAIANPAARRTSRDDAAAGIKRGVDKNRGRNSGDLVRQIDANQVREQTSRQTDTGLSPDPAQGAAESSTEGDATGSVSRPGGDYERGDSVGSLKERLRRVSPKDRKTSALSPSMKGTVKPGGGGSGCPDECKIPSPPPPTGGEGVPVPYPNSSDKKPKQSSETPSRPAPGQGDEASQAKTKAFLCKVKKQCDDAKRDPNVGTIDPAPGSGSAGINLSKKKRPRKTGAQAPVEPPQDAPEYSEVPPELQGGKKTGDFEGAGGGTAPPLSQ